MAGTARAFYEGVLRPLQVVQLRRPVPPARDGATPHLSPIVKPAAPSRSPSSSSSRPRRTRIALGPPKGRPGAFLCNCLHCGPEGHPFEAIEMRWMTTERMWACPCTTCGGRGFSFGHPLRGKQVAVRRLAGISTSRKNNDYHADNAKCPQVAARTSPTGWFDSDYDEEEFEDDLIP